MEYTVKKTNFGKKYTRFMYVFFENGDYITIDGSELLNISVNVYDKLIRHNNGFCALAESGCIELKIKERIKLDFNSNFLYNPQEHKNNRKKYIEQRCLKESCITEIWFFNKHYWHYELLGNFSVETDEEKLRLIVLPQPKIGNFSNDTHKIVLKEIKKKDVCCIDLDFENCESFMVFNNEIEEIDLVLDKRLVLGSDRYYRRVNEGYIKLKLRKKILPRAYYLFDDKDLKRKDVERRLCGKEGFSAHDICHLNIDFYHADYGNTLQECVEVGAMKPNKEVERFIKQEEDDCADFYQFESGYAKLLKDRTIILTFGNNAKQLMKELCKHKKRST